MTVTDYMSQEKKEEEDLPALKTALTRRYNDSPTTEKSTGAGTDFSRQKQYWQHRDQQNGNNQKTKMERKLYGCFKWVTNNITNEKTWTWQRKREKENHF